MLIGPKAWFLLDVDQLLFGPKHMGPRHMKIKAYFQGFIEIKPIYPMLRGMVLEVSQT